MLPVASAQLPARAGRYDLDGHRRSQQRGSSMPTVSTFFGVDVRMYFDDHEPPHFHAYYGGAAVRIAIDSLGVIDGGLPRRALALVIEWAFARRHEPLVPIAPLD